MVHLLALLRGEDAMAIIHSWQTDIPIASVCPVSTSLVDGKGKICSIAWAWQQAFPVLSLVSGRKRRNIADEV
jgi:hypothetical protein